MTLEGFVAEMREQGIHVGLGQPPMCVVCEIPWPCASASPMPEPPCLGDAAELAIGD